MVKKKKVKKPAAKKAVKRVASSKHELVVRVEPVPQPTTRDLEPITEKSKYFLPKTWMTEGQIIRLVQKTPPQHVYRRPAKGGGMWDYVTGNYVEKILNFVFGWLWDFEIVDKGREGGQVWVLGKLSVKDGKGNTIIKTQFGRADIKFKKGSTTEMLDYGNDLKAAATDSLKKSASLLGIASDIYGKAEFKEQTGTEVAPVSVVAPNTPPAVHSPAPVVKEDKVFRCKEGGEEISEQEAIYSQRMFGKPLCREHQKDAKNKK